MDKTHVSSLQRELENLDKEEDGRKSAMKVVKSYVKDLDSKAIPVFLAQIYEAKENGTLSGEYTISVYEVIARSHGPKVVPYIGSIMSTIVKTLASSSGSLPLQQVCSRVVSATARYAIDPSTPVDRKRYIIHTLCEPLSDSLLGSQESLASGSALCIKVLVESNNWSFASDKMVNQVCQNVAAALEEKSSQTNALMDLVMALAKHNALVMEAYARLLIQSGLKILNAAEGNSQKRLAVIQMLNFLMKCLDPRSIYSEVEMIIEEMEKCQSDRLPYVKGSAYEALQTAMKIARDKASESENGCGAVSGLKFGRGDHNRRRNLPGGNGESSASLAYRSQSLDSFLSGSLVESPLSNAHVSCNVRSGGRSVNQTLTRYEPGGDNVALDDCLLSEMACGGSMCNSTSKHCEHADNGEQYTEELERSFQRNGGNGFCWRRTPSPQKSISQFNVCNIKSFTNKRNHFHAVQDPSDINSEFYGNQAQRFRSRSSENFEWSPHSNRNGFQNDGEQLTVASESVSSSKKVIQAVRDRKKHQKTASGMILSASESVSSSKEVIQAVRDRKKHQKTASGMILSLFLTAIAVYFLLLLTDRPDAVHLVPT